MVGNEGREADEDEGDEAQRGRPSGRGEPRQRVEAVLLGTGASAVHAEGPRARPARAALATRTVAVARPAAKFTAK